MSKPTILIVKDNWQIDVWKGHDGSRHLTVGDDIHMNGIDAPIHFHTKAQVEEFIADLRAAAQSLQR